ncbi:hypothetical protein TELCIR_24511, partial [Teladorsagia circumcincta]
MQCLAHLPPFTRYIVEKHRHSKGLSGRYGPSQQDAHEFLIALISRLDHESSDNSKNSSNLSTPFEQMFFGKTRKEIECSCGAFKTLYQKFLELNLALPYQSNGCNRVTITDLLKIFVKKQQVEHKCD